MGVIFSDAARQIGKTPMRRLKNIEREVGCEAGIFAKLEMFNPTGSTKDRAALFMLMNAEREGRLRKSFVCATSGNMGISLASLASARGLHAVIVMPKTMSEERKRLLRAYGAELLLTEGGMAEAAKRAEAVAKERDAALLEQFEDMSNPEAHYTTTGPEIFEDLGGHVDVFVAGVGSGGTISGAGRYLKERTGNVHIVAVEPARSPVLSGGSAGRHGIQGIGAGFVPHILDISLLDEVIAVTEEESADAARLLAKKEGILCGISSGAALSAALRIAKREGRKRNIVVIFPDGGERYLSAGLFE